MKHCLSYVLSLTLIMAFTACALPQAAGSSCNIEGLTICISRSDLTYLQCDHGSWLQRSAPPGVICGDMPGISITSSQAAVSVVVTASTVSLATSAAADILFSTSVPASVPTSILSGTPVGVPDLPAPSPAIYHESSASQYQLFRGDGSPMYGWPEMSNFVIFEDMWNWNQDLIKNSCPSSVAPNSADETQSLYAAINIAAYNSAIDPRYILAMVLQESKGCVRVKTTNYGVFNPGLMQSAGLASCNDGTSPPINPCTQTQIQNMINDGVGLTPHLNNSLQQSLYRAGQTAVVMNTTQFFQATLAYNAGLDALTELASQGFIRLEHNPATACYSSDIANRLVGWNETSRSTCNIPQFTYDDVSSNKYTQPSKWTMPAS